MEEQYSVQFFTSFVQHLQEVCRNYLNYDQFVEVSGYVCVEIDNMKKERYVLSELLQSSGIVVSESYCTKAIQTSASRSTIPRSWNPEEFISIKRENKENESESELCQQSRELTPDNSDQYLVLQSSCPSSEVQFHPDTVQTTKVHEKQVRLPQRCQNDPTTQQHASSEMSDYTEILPSTSAETTSFQQEEEIIDLNSSDDDLDIPESMETAGSEDYVEAAVSSPRSSFTLMKKKSTLSPGTLAAVRNSVRKFSRFHFDKHGKDVNILSTPPEQLNELLLEYFEGARKITGGALTGTTLKTVQKHLDMYLKDKGYPHTIGKSREFHTSREYLKTRMSETEKPVSQVHSPVNDNDTEILFQTKQLGGFTAEALMNTMWFLNSKYFGVKRPAEHFNMKWGDLQLRVNQQGQEYLERPIHGSFTLKAFAQPEDPDRCFVNFYKKYRTKRPKVMMDVESPFYLKPQKNSDVWYHPEQVSYSSFTYIWRKMLTVAKLPSDKRIL